MHTAVADGPDTSEAWERGME
ncbi:hypothetical protein F383_33903 [Gossypium arboreum]|uniref:Uncharacterized protein n=1 Tax=Gossypium arboreum TaxID=29729 RepID=A0A0B0N6I2_GOSAR|nr:hypothetical protein F383_33903 [Gossypium arboreum]